MTRRDRRGLTLLEVVIATAILAGSFAVLGSLLESARVASTRARYELEAVTRAESLIDELVAGVLPLEAVDRVAYDGEPQWSYEVGLAETEFETLTLVVVRVWHADAQRTVDADVSLARQLFVPPESSESGLVF
ncbi:MAG: prepilin-type N-terminal cleavage/methylation domain-containing protein [Planctomycetota bacterium]